jgi:hypothetical protein
MVQLYLNDGKTLQNDKILFVSKYGQGAIFDSFNRLSIENCKEYSESPEQLERLINSLNISITITNRYNDSFTTGKDKNRIIKVNINKNNQHIEYDFNISIVDTKILNTPHNKRKYGEYSKTITSFLYSILCCCRSDYYCPISFDDFCLEYGYNNDSIKVRDLFLECLDMRAKLERIFTAEEIEYLPS